MIKNISLLFGSLIFVVILAEITLQFMPVSEGFDFQDVNDENWSFHSRPERRMVQASIGPAMRVNIKKQVNDSGFVNPLIYLKQNSNGLRPMPLVSVIGDSYVEAIQVKDNETFFFHLDNDNPQLDVYSFAFSGAPLSQYLAWAKHSKETYNNKFLIINIVGNDFDQSLMKYKSSLGFHYYEKSMANELELMRVNLTKDCNGEPSIFKDIFYCKFAQNSSLANYLLRNLKIMSAVQLFKARFLESPKTYIGNVLADVNIEREQDSYQAIEAFFRDLPSYSGLEKKQILFVMDGMRTVYHSEEKLKKAEMSYFGKMRRYFFKRSKELGYDYIDMHKVFNAHYQENEQHFEVPYDGHWNQLAHKLVADSIQSSLFWSRVISED